VTVWDVLVVGGGPVGLSAAIEARLAGLTVLLVERRTGTIDKACGEGLMPGAVPLLARLGVDPRGEPLRGVVYRQGDVAATHRFAGEPGRGVRRTVLHAALLARADELGVHRVTATVIGLEPHNDRISVQTEESDDVLTDTQGEIVGTPLSALYLLACDGLHSTVARLAGLSLPGPVRGRRYGIRQHYAMAPWSDNIEVFYGPRAEFYVTPVDDKTVGIAMLAGKGVDFDKALARIPALAGRLSDIPLATGRRGAGPFRQKTKARTAGRVLLLGDASGYVDAITGEGLRLGFAQARAAVESIVSGDPLSYERRWKRQTRSFRVLTTVLVRVASSPLRRGIVPLAARFPRLFGVVVERLAR
jgi:flavin-dependent dehydrogenase